MFRRCCCGPDLNPECASLTGSWNTESGTWSPVTVPFWGSGYRCTSPGSRIYTPTSGLDPSDRQGIHAGIFGESSSDNYVAGVIFDADDEDNCHRLKVTHTPTTKLLTLERVSGGAPTTISEWGKTSGNLEANAVNFMQAAEFINYVAAGLNEVGFNTLFPIDGSYSKRNSKKLGYFVDSFDGSHVDVAPGSMGRVLCAPVGTAMCGPSFADSVFGYMGGTDEVSAEIIFQGYSAGDTCAGYDWGAPLTLEFTSSVDNEDTSFPEYCGWDEGWPPPTCAATSGDGTWEHHLSIYHHYTPYTDYNVAKNCYGMGMKLQVYRNTGPAPGSIEILFRGETSADGFLTGKTLTLTHDLITKSGTLPFDCTGATATVTML